MIDDSKRGPGGGPQSHSASDEGAATNRVADRWAEADPANPLKALRDLVGDAEAVRLCAALADPADVRAVAAAAAEDTAADAAADTFRDTLGATVVARGSAWDTVRAAVGRLDRVPVTAWRIADWRHRHGRGAAPAAPGRITGYAQPGGGGVRGRLAGLLRELAAAGEGNRQSLLHWTACRVADMAEAGEVDVAACAPALGEAAAETGLPQHEIDDVLRRLVNGGLR
jgi:hypothetical protein